MKECKKVFIMLLLSTGLFTLGGCGNPILKSLQELSKIAEDYNENNSQTETENLQDKENEEEGNEEEGNEEEGREDIDENEAEDGGTRYQKSYGSYIILDDWIEVDRSTDTKSFYAKDGTENDLRPDNISVEVGTNPYSLEEHEEFGRAIQAQLAAQLAQIDSDTTLTGSGTTTENGDIVYIFTIEEAGKGAAVQYYIVGEKRYCMVYETIYSDKEECDRVAQKIVDSFQWAE